MIKPLSSQEITRFYQGLRAETPHPETELEYTSPFELLIAVMLSAQATDVSVNKATRRLYCEASTPKAMLALGVERVEDMIKTIGLFRTKAKNVIAISRILVEQHDGQVPTTREALEALPGVGRKTANVILNTIFGEPTVAVDTHIFRVANRTGLAIGKDVVKVEDALIKRTPKEFILDCHHWLILHGRYVCKARVPECWRCAVREVCHFDRKTARPASSTDERSSA
jgi:endonuclease-3